MKLRLMAIVASTALVPAVALAQTPSSPPQSAQARPGQPGAQVTAADFVNKAAVSNMFEIQSSQLAQQKTQNDRVREFAQRMVQDHTAAGDRLKSTAQSIQGVTVPTSLDQPHQQMMQTLQNASGTGFDRAYVQMQVTAHRDAVSLFDRYAQNGENPQLKQFAQQTVPTLREHLQSVEQIQTALPPAQVGAAQGGQQTAQNQGEQDPSRIVVQRSAPTIRVDQADPRVTVRQPQPQVTVNQAQPEIIVRQPQPTVRVDIPQPEIIVRMPEPDVNVAMAQPQVQVNQPQPQVQVVQPQQQPQVQVDRSQPQVMVQRQANAEPNVQVQQAEGQPTVRYERAQPRVIVNQAQGQPNVRIERQGESQQAEAQDQAAQPQQQAAVSNPQATGALPDGQAIAVSRVTDMDLYNARGNELGDVERVVQGQDGKQYLVVGAGGFLGIGERDIAVPTDRIAMQGDRLVIQGVTEDQLRAMQPFDSNNRNFRELDNNQQVQINAMR